MTTEEKKFVELVKIKMDALYKQIWADLEKAFETGPKPVTHISDKCECGHLRGEHIYGEGACRPGFLCLMRCEQFKAGYLPEVKDE